MAVGHPKVSYRDRDTAEVKLATWDGTMWVYESITPGWTAGTLAIAPAGSMAVVYDSRQGCRAPEVAPSKAIGTTAVHRGIVTSLAPGWQTASLPLTSLNDDETPHFPVAVTPPGSLSDPSPPAVPLVLHRVLRTGSTDTGNALRVAARQHWPPSLAQGLHRSGTSKEVEMHTWKRAQEEVLARLAEARKLIEARDEGGVIALVNQQDAFCDAAKERQPPEMAQVLEKQCHYCEGFLQSGGCMGRLDAIDRSVMHGEWDEARELLDEYAAWIKSLDVKA